MLNLQTIEKREERVDGVLDVHSIFGTIQGEGPFAGHPAVFVRLAGCSLACPSCDTDYTFGRQLVSSVEVMNKVLELTKGRRGSLIVLTGGEPLRQSIGDFLTLAISHHEHRVQIESNGINFDPSIERWRSTSLTLVCSPKTAKLHQRTIERIDYLKYILQAGEVDPTDGLPTSSLNYGIRPIRPWKGMEGKVYVQPADDQDEVKNKANQQAAVESCLKFGFMLCLQLHKIVNLP